MAHGKQCGCDCPFWLPATSQLGLCIMRPQKLDDHEFARVVTEQWQGQRARDVPRTRGEPNRHEFRRLRSTVILQTKSKQLGLEAVRYLLEYNRVQRRKFLQCWLHGHN